MPYFCASLCLVNQEREPYDLDLIRALVLQTRYLQAFSSFSAAHATVLAAASAAMHLGLHLNHANLKASFTAKELYERRKLFAVIHSVETALCFTLGLPRTLKQADQQQILGLPEDALADEGAAVIAADPFSRLAETVMAQKALSIGAIVHDDRTARPSAIPTDRIALAEAELQRWESTLPDLPSASHNRRALTGQLNVRMIYTAVRLHLYSPYLDHLSKDPNDPSYSAAGFEHASSCVRAATQAVLLVETMQSQDIMCSVYWLTRYLLLWASNVLSYFVIHSKSRVTIEESASAAIKARDLLGTLGLTNTSAKQMHDIVDPSIDLLAGILS